MKIQNAINHVAFVLDASDSMRGIGRELIKVADKLIADLAELSTQLKQETRVTVYTFSNEVQCIIYDMDVLRLPSIAEFYRTVNMTALIDATVQAREELGQTATLYGDHAFLVYVLTDGQENVSRRSVGDLGRMFSTLPDNYTMACLVPNQTAKFTVVKYGFPQGNVQIWDASSEAGMREAGQVLSASTAAYMDARAQGMTNTKNLFSMGASTVNHKTVAKLQEITSSITVLPVRGAIAIRPFIEVQHAPMVFESGKYYFPLVKREKISKDKKILIRHKISGKVYGGPQARQLLGLPDNDVSVKPDFNDLYDVFVQSTSQNRLLVAGHALLILN